ncbi:MAG: hypothetical protein B1H13_02700 [Desulfobacteraceae bacterium 4484_190.3]|nr:MAG: hypothetical protein B1H13_02700 [Desulfobacteraceae bacterium 4484_190.3]
MINKKMKAILKSAEFLFSTKGFSQTTVADIAKESDVHEASIYAYFKNKKNILFEIYGGYLENAIETLNEHFQGMKEPGPKLRKAIWHYLADMKNNPNYARILMLAQRENPDFYTSEHLQYVKKYSGLVLRIIIAGQKEGFFRADISPRLIRNMGMGASVFAAFDSIAHGHVYDPNDMSDRIYQLVLNASGVQAYSPENNAKSNTIGRTELRRSQIIETATRVFADRGYSKATISKIAKQADLGDATLYEYFGNKEAILLGTAETYLQELLLDENNNPEGIPEAEKTLRKLIWRWIWMLYRNEHFSRILVLELFRNIKFYSSPGYRFLADFFEMIRTTVLQGQREGTFIEDVPFPTYSHMIIGTFDQYLLSQFLLGKPPLGLAELDRIVDTLVRVIKIQE